LSLHHAAVSIDLVFSMEGLAQVLTRRAAHQGRSSLLERAVGLFGEAAALRARLGAAASRSWPIPLTPTTRDEHERQVAAAHAALGEEAFEAAWAKGQQLPLEQAIAEAVTAAVAACGTDAAFGGARSQVSPNVQQKLNAPLSGRSSRRAR
jgi:hypothetical protein